jgi:hypothetical protein
MKKNSNSKRNGLVRVLGADALTDSSRQLDTEALKRVIGGFTMSVNKSTPKL